MQRVSNWFLYYTCMHLQDSEQSIGGIGGVMVFAGIVGSICAGLLLNKTRRYK